MSFNLLTHVKNYFFFAKVAFIVQILQNFQTRRRLSKPFLIYYSWLNKLRHYCFIPTASTCPCINLPRSPLRVSALFYYGTINIPFVFMDIISNLTDILEHKQTYHVFKSNNPAQFSVYHISTIHSRSFQSIRVLRQILIYVTHCTHCASNI